MPRPLRIRLQDWNQDWVGATFEESHSERRGKSDKAAKIIYESCPVGSRTPGPWGHTVYKLTRQPPAAGSWSLNTESRLVGFVDPFPGAGCRISSLSPSKLTSTCTRGLGCPPTSIIHLLEREHRPNIVHGHGRLTGFPNLLRTPQSLVQAVPAQGRLQ